MKPQSSKFDSKRSKIIVRRESFGPPTRQRTKVPKLQIEWKRCPELEGSAPSPERRRIPINEERGGKKGQEGIFGCTAQNTIALNRTQICGNNPIIIVSPIVQEEAENIRNIPQVMYLQNLEEHKEDRNTHQRVVGNQGVLGLLSASNDSNTSYSSEVVSSEENKSPLQWVMPPERDANEQQNLTRLLSIRSQGISLSGLTQKHLLPPLLTHKQSPKKTIFLNLYRTIILLVHKDIAYLLDQVPLLFTSRLKIPFLIRRGATQFVETLAENCEIVLYSSGTMEYIADIINRVPKFNSNIKYVLSRDDCCKFGERYLKSAKILNRSPENVIVVDNSYSVYPEDLDNVLPVTSFNNAEMYETDNELFKALGDILKLIEVKDVRESLKSQYKLTHKLNEFLGCLGSH